jgi:hypothetical protein
MIHGTAWRCSSRVGGLEWVPMGSCPAPAIGILAALGRSGVSSEVIAGGGSAGGGSVAGGMGASRGGVAGRGRGAGRGTGGAVAGAGTVGGSGDVPQSCVV